MEEDRGIKMNQAWNMIRNELYVMQYVDVKCMWKKIVCIVSPSIIGDGTVVGDVCLDSSVAEFIMNDEYSGDTETRLETRYGLVMRFSGERDVAIFPDGKSFVVRRESESQKEDRRMKELRKSALEKLTSDEKVALGLVDATSGTSDKLIVSQSKIPPPGAKYGIPLW